MVDFLYNYKTLDCVENADYIVIEVLQYLKQ